MVHQQTYPRWLFLGVHYKQHQEEDVASAAELTNFHSSTLYKCSSNYSLNPTAVPTLFIPTDYIRQKGMSDFLQCYT